MGKKKDAGPGEKKLRLPKRVAGVKVSKEWRRSGEALIAQAQSPAGQAAIAQGVSMVAALAASAAKAAAQNAAGGKAATGKAAAGTTSPEPVAASSPAGASQPAADVFAKTVTAGVEAALGRLFARR